MNPKKVALVTGASSGIGEETAKQLWQAGYTVYGAARRLDRMKDLEEMGGKVLHLDITDEESIRSCVNNLLQQEGRLDVLVNNAGYGSYGTVEEVPLSEARRQFEVNLFGLARLTQLVLPTMRNQKSGYIFNVSSIGGKIYTPLGAWYHATKHALEGFSDALRLELKDFGIHVVVIEPGAIATEWDGIAVENMVKASGNGAYAEFTRRVKRLMERGASLGSPPSVIARVILKALKSRAPKTRYAAGRGSRVALWGRALLSDRGYDRVLGWIMRS